MYANRSIKAYIELLSEKTPTPGGGSAAALVAALGAAQCSMVIRYTLASARYAHTHPRMRRLLKKSEAIRTKALAGIDRDVIVFEELQKTLRARRSGARNARLCEARFKDATRAPLTVCRLCAEAMEICGALAVHGNELLMSDTVGAAELLRGAFASAQSNVSVNLRGVKDARFRALVRRAMKQAQHCIERYAKQVRSRARERC